MGTASAVGALAVAYNPRCHKVCEATEDPRSTLGRPCLSCLLLSAGCVTLTQTLAFSVPLLLRLGCPRWPNPHHSHTEVGASVPVTWVREASREVRQLTRGHSARGSRTSLGLGV